MLPNRYHHRRLLRCIFVRSFASLRMTGKAKNDTSLSNSIANTNIFGHFRKNSSPRPISTSQLRTSLFLHFWPINLIVYKGSYCVNHMRDLILEQVSRLDAFSVYLFRGSLNSHALGRTTVTREPRPFRSSRTRNRFPQISCAHTG